MKIRHTSGGLSDKVPIDMTPMIDIVFQLLAFFIMTLKFVVLEGDFNIKMPLGPGQASNQDEIPPPVIPVQLLAGTNGNLAQIRAGGNEIQSFTGLTAYLLQFVGPETGPGSSREETEVELDCSYNLRYEHVIEAITAITGTVVQDGDTRRVVPLIEKIKFTPVKPPGTGDAEAAE